MKRQVKAWVVPSANAGAPCQRTIDSTFESAAARVLLVFTTREEGRAYFGGDSGITPCVVTYDDGRKSPPRKRRGGGK